MQITVEKFKALLKDFKEELYKRRTSAFLSMNIAYHKVVVALQTDLQIQCCLLQIVKVF